MKTFFKHQRLAETENGDVLVKSCRFVKLGVLRLAADLIAQLAVLAGPVVVPGEHNDIPHILTCTNTILLRPGHSLSVSYPECSEPLSGSRLC